MHSAFGLLSNWLNRVKVSLVRSAALLSGHTHTRARAFQSSLGSERGRTCSTAVILKQFKGNVSDRNADNRTENQRFHHLSIPI